MDSAIVIRRNKTPMTFIVYNHLPGAHLCYRTTKNWYAILPGLEVGKPFWIGRLVTTANGKKSWVTWENELRAILIKFSDGSEYYFPSY